MTAIGRKRTLLDHLPLICCNIPVANHMRPSMGLLIGRKQTFERKILI